jgi:hypothetical protein
VSREVEGWAGPNKNGELSVHFRVSNERFDAHVQSSSLVEALKEGSLRCYLRV